jgi:hypothetical protein
MAATPTAPVRVVLVERAAPAAPWVLGRGPAADVAAAAGVRTAFNLNPAVAAPRNRPPTPQVHLASSQSHAPVDCGNNGFPPRDTAFMIRKCGCGMRPYWKRSRHLNPDALGLGIGQECRDAHRWDKVRFLKSFTHIL